MEMKFVPISIFIILLTVYFGMYWCVQRTRLSSTAFKLRRNPDDINLKWVETNFHQNQSDIMVITNLDPLRRQLDERFLARNIDSKANLKYIGLFTSSNSSESGSILDHVCAGACEEQFAKKFAQAKRNIKKHFLLIAADSQIADFARLAPKMAPSIFRNIDFTVIKNKKSKNYTDDERILVNFLQKELNGQLTRFNIRNKAKI